MATWLSCTPAPLGASTLPGCPRSGHGFGRGLFGGFDGGGITADMADQLRADVAADHLGVHLLGLLFVSKAVKARGKVGALGTSPGAPSRRAGAGAAGSEVRRWWGIDRCSRPGRRETSRCARAEGGRFRAMRSGASRDRGLAEKAGLHPVYVGKVKRGEQWISLHALLRVAEALRIPLRDLVSEP